MTNNMFYSKQFCAFGRRADAVCLLRGSDKFPDIRGEVKFYQLKSGVLTVAEVLGLPREDEKCHERIFAFHIHSGSSCTGNEKDPFANADGHYNPDDCSHPYHAGDMPPLFGADGRAFSAFLTNRFNVKAIIGKTVIVHSSPDDFMTQPSGNAGEKIACGVIMAIR